MTWDFQAIVIAIISVFAAGGGAAGIFSWLKERKKDDATALLTNVEALQKQVVLLTSVTDYLRKENAQLALDRDAEQERSRKLRVRLGEVEEELEEVRRTASRAQEQVNALSTKVRLLASGEEEHAKRTRPRVNPRTDQS